MNPDNQRHKAIKLADGSTALVSDTAGFALEIVGAIEVIAVMDQISGSICIRTYRQESWILLQSRKNKI